MEQILTRQEARREDTWALEDLYENEAACRKAAEEVAKKVDSFRQRTVRSVKGVQFHEPAL